MIAHLALLLLARQAPSQEVARFKVAFAARRSNIATERPDPAVGKCLDILVKAVERGLRAYPHATEKQVDRWVEPFGKAVAKLEEKEVDLDAYRSVFARTYASGEWRFIVAAMGFVTRTVAFDRAWHELRMPEEFSWNTPWCPEPVRLPKRLCLMNCFELRLAGMQEGLRFVWLRPSGRAMRIIGRFKGVVLIDRPAVSVRHGVVSVRTIDDPVSFTPHVSFGFFGRLTEWNCASGRPRWIRSVPLDRPLRAVDSAIAAADAAKHPTPLQRLIRKAWPRDEYRRAIDQWSEKRLRNGTVRETIDGDRVFELRKVRGRYRVVSARAQGRVSTAPPSIGPGR